AFPGRSWSQNRTPEHLPRRRRGRPAPAAGPRAAGRLPAAGPVAEATPGPPPPGGAAQRPGQAAGDPGVPAWGTEHPISRVFFRAAVEPEGVRTMATRHLRLPPAVSRAVSRFVGQLCALEGPELAAAVERVRATGGDRRALDIALHFLVRRLRGRAPARQRKAAQVLELLGPVAAPQLVADLYETPDAAFRLRLVGVLAGIGAAAREVVSTALIGLLGNQVDAALREAAWKG